MSSYLALADRLEKGVRLGWRSMYARVGTCKPQGRVEIGTSFFCTPRRSDQEFYISGVLQPSMTGFVLERRSVPRGVRVKGIGPVDYSPTRVVQ